MLRLIVKAYDKDRLVLYPKINNRDEEEHTMGGKLNM